MKKICFLTALLMCLLSLPCYAEEEPVNVFALSSGNLASVFFDAKDTNGKGPTNIKNNSVSGGLKNALTNGITYEANNDRLFVEKPANYTTYELNTAQGTPAGTVLPGVSVVFKFDAGKQTGVNRLVIFAGDASRAKGTDIALGSTLSPENITVSYSSQSSNPCNYTRVGFKPIDCRYSTVIIGNNTKGEQILTLDLNQEITAPYIKICIKSANGAFRIREVEAYNINSEIKPSSVIQSANINNIGDAIEFNTTDTSQANTYIAAKYDANGNLTKAGVQKADETGYVNFNGQGLTVSSADDSETKESIRIFMWDGENNMKPVSDFYTVIPKNAKTKTLPTA